MVVRIKEEIILKKSTMIWRNKKSNNAGPNLRRAKLLLLCFLILSWPCISPTHVSPMCYSLLLCPILDMRHNSAVSQMNYEDLYFSSSSLEINFSCFQLAFVCRTQSPKKYNWGHDLV